MTKRISQASTVVVPVVPANSVDGKVVATQAVVVPAEADAASAKAEAKTDEAPETVVALVAPAPMAMVAQDTAAPAPATTDPVPPAATTPADEDAPHKDMTPYIVGGVLLAGGVLAIALSSGDDDNSTATPTPTPAANTAPTFAAATATATVAENTAATTTVFTAAATDAQSNTITYTLGGTDAALFNINASTGVVTLKTSANFETKASYSFTVTATDNATTPLSSTPQTVTLNVTNVNEAPTFTTASQAVSFAENGAGTVLTAAATDVDAGATLAYTLTGTDAALFNVSSAGAVTFKAAPDFEAVPTKTSYSFNVVATDQAGLTATQAETVTLTNVNEAPTFTSGATATIAENVAAGTAIYTSVTTDPEGTARTYSLGGTDAAAFTVNATTGVVSINSSPDFETKSSYSFTVNASDGTNTTARPVTLSVTDIANEGPATVTTSLDTAATVTVSGLATGGGAQSTVFTDAATSPSNATINNFGSDDSVRFTGTTSVSFSSVDNDLLIEFVSGGNVNQIKINDIVSPNAIITSEASAEAAVNAFFGTTNSDYFRFA